MQIDKDKLNKFLNLSDEELKKKVADAAKSSGLESNKLNHILKDTQNIKKMISSMTEDDLQKAINSIKDEKAAQIIQNLQNQQ